MNEPIPTLRRVLGTPRLVFCGLGVIIGSGIYVLVGSVVAWPAKPRPVVGPGGSPGRAVA